MFESILNIVDISPYIYSGLKYKTNQLAGVVECGDQYKQRIIKAGGVAFLMQAIRSMNGNLVFCGERIPTVKRISFPSYKINRVHSPGDDVNKQRRLAEYILEDCGFVLESQEGYEADDLVYSYWKTYGKDYSQVLLYAKDSDMHFMVNETCNIMPVNSKSKLVAMDNVESVSNRDRFLPYNSVVLSKVIYGDSKDNIPCVLSGRYSDIMFSLVINDPFIINGHSRDANEFLIRKYAPKESVNDLLLNLELVFPCLVDVKPPSMDYDKEKFGEWCRALDVFGYGRMQTSNRISRLIPTLYEELNQM